MEKRYIARCAGCYKLVDGNDIFCSFVYYPKLDIIMCSDDFPGRESPRPNRDCVYNLKDKFLKDCLVHNAGLEHRLYTCSELPKEGWISLRKGIDELQEKRRLELIEKIEASKSKEVNDPELQTLAEIIKEYTQAAREKLHEIIRSLPKEEVFKGCGSDRIPPRKSG